MGKAVNEIIQEKMIGHQIGLLRLSSGITARLAALLNKVEDDLIAQLSSLENERVNAVLQKVRNLLYAAKPDQYNLMKKELTGLAQYETEYVSKIIGGAMPVEFNIAIPSTTFLSSIVVSRPFQGGLLKEWISDLTDSKRRLVRDAVRQGMVEGQTISQIAKRIRGTKAAKYKDGLMEISRRGARSMVRTAVNHTATNARESLYLENSELISGVQIVATLDGRTTPYCQAIDGKTFPVSKGPRPPFHIGCRTTTTPIIKSFKELGFNIDEAPESTRASMNGQAPAKMTYNQWLKGQSVEKQDEILGPKRGKLFREGMSVDKFTDIKTGEHYTLKDLKKNEK